MKFICANNMMTDTVITTDNRRYANEAITIARFSYPSSIFLFRRFPGALLRRCFGRNDNETVIIGFSLARYVLCLLHELWGYLRCAAETEGKQCEEGLVFPPL